jgi:prophage regulatory protein
MATMATEAQTFPRQLLRLPEVLNRTGLSRSRLYAKQRDGTFPRSVSLGGGAAVAWASDEVQAWIDSQVTARDARHGR